MVGHFDHETGKDDRYSLGQSIGSEVLFIPKSEDVGEGKSVLLTVGSSFETHSSNLYIFDALEISKGPLAVVHLSHCVPAGSHVTWRQCSYRYRHC